MTGVCPQTPIHYFAFVARIRLELRELPIPNRFKPESYQPGRQPYEVEHSQSCGLNGKLSFLNRQRNNPHQNSLQPEHNEQTYKRKTRPDSFAHRLITKVLPFAVIPPAYVNRGSESPDYYKSCYQQ